MIKELEPDHGDKVRVLINNVMFQALTQAMELERAFKEGGILCLDGQITRYGSAYQPATNDGLLVSELRNSPTAKKAWVQIELMSDRIMALLPMEVVHEQ